MDIPIQTCSQDCFFESMLSISRIFKRNVARLGQSYTFTKSALSIIIFSYLTFTTRAVFILKKPHITMFLRISFIHTDKGRHIGTARFLDRVVTWQIISTSRTTVSRLLNDLVAKFNWATHWPAINFTILKHNIKNQFMQTFANVSCSLSNKRCNSAIQCLGVEQYIYVNQYDHFVTRIGYVTVTF